MSEDPVEWDNIGSIPGGLPSKAAAPRKTPVVSTVTVAPLLAGAPAAGQSAPAVLKSRIRQKSAAHQGRHGNHTKRSGKKSLRNASAAKDSFEKELQYAEMQSKLAASQARAAAAEARALAAEAKLNEARSAAAGNHSEEVRAKQEAASLRWKLHNAKKRLARVEVEKKVAVQAAQAVQPHEAGRSSNTTKAGGKSEGHPRTLLNPKKVSRRVTQR